MKTFRKTIIFIASVLNGVYFHYLYNSEEPVIYLRPIIILLMLFALVTGKN